MTRLLAAAVAFLFALCAVPEPAFGVRSRSRMDTQLVKDLVAMVRHVSSTTGERIVYAPPTRATLGIACVASVPSFGLLGLFGHGDEKTWRDLPRPFPRPWRPTREALRRGRRIVRMHLAPAARGRWLHHVAHARRVRQ